MKVSGVGPKELKEDEVRAFTGIRTVFLICMGFWGVVCLAAWFATKGG